MVAILRAVTLFVCLVAGAVQAHEIVRGCLPASYGNAKSKSYEAYSDEFGNYTEFHGVQYGVSMKDEAYVGTDAEHVLISNIKFRDPDGKSVALKADELALSRAVAYVSKANRAVVCVLSPFSGIGSSGGFQSVAGLIAVQKPNGRSRLKVEGAIVRVK